MPDEAYLSMVIREFARLKGLADQAISQMPPDQFFGIPGEGDNSVAVIVKHVAGNLLSRWRDFLTSDGEKPDRRRDEEFVISANDSRGAVLARWEDGRAALLGALAPLRTSDLNRTVIIRGEPLSVLQAINRQLTHYAYHVGQIVYLAKHYCGPGWKSLSIPLGQSERFNRAPEKYVGKA